VPLKPTALPGERALVALDDKARAAEMAASLAALGYEVDTLSDADGVRVIDQMGHVIVVMARTVAESGAFTCYQRLSLLNSDTRRSFFLILVGDEYTTADGVQAFVVHGDLVIASPDTASCEAIIRERLVERTRLFRVFVDSKRKHEAAH
jgi:PleD family two-component response regulator